MLCHCFVQRETISHGSMDFVTEQVNVWEQISETDGAILLDFLFDQVFNFSWIKTEVGYGLILIQILFVYWGDISIVCESMWGGDRMHGLFSSVSLSTAFYGLHKSVMFLEKSPFIFHYFHHIYEKFVPLHKTPLHEQLWKGVSTIRKHLTITPVTLPFHMNINEMVSSCICFYTCITEF